MKIKEIQEIDKTHESIGWAEIAPDGTLTLYLVARGKGKMIGHGTLIYKKDDPKYMEIKNHIGPIQPGEKKSVRPWAR